MFIFEIVPNLPDKHRITVVKGRTRVIVLIKTRIQRILNSNQIHHKGETELCCPPCTTVRLKTWESRAPISVLNEH